MVQLTLWGHPKAFCTQRVLILLDLLNLKYTFESVDLEKGEHMLPEYLQLQPFAKVPVMQYGDSVIFESRAILRYIAANNTQTKDLLGDFTADMWLEVESQNFCPPASHIVLAKLYRKGDTSDEAINKSTRQLESVLDVYERRLNDFQYIGGETLTIADISHVPYLHGLIRAGYKGLLKSRPNVYNWVKRVSRATKVV